MQIRFYAIFSQITQIRKFIVVLTTVLDEKYLLLSGSHIFCNFGREHEFNLRFLKVQPKTQSPNQKVDKRLSFSFFFLTQINDK